MTDPDTFQVRAILDIPDWAPRFTGIIDRDAKDFRDHPVCDCCDTHGAVYVEFTVNDEVDGPIATDAMFCADHAPDEVRCILDRADRSTDHDTDVTVNYWAIQYGVFTESSAVAA
ncbi:hypothetical protein ACFRAQ_36110 [Nocardia sp. NPDC056611]|uniref:hypothetical protein n=1 Tax=Nocardia sp. NPDC056611 TaxID=3345877 RepID=UPI00366F0391